MHVLKLVTVICAVIIAILLLLATGAAISLWPAHGFFPCLTIAVIFFVLAEEAETDNMPLFVSVMLDILAWVFLLFPPGKELVLSEMNVYTKCSFGVLMAGSAIFNMYIRYHGANWSPVLMAWLLTDEAVMKPVLKFANWLIRLRTLRPAGPLASEWWRLRQLRRQRQQNQQ